MSVHRRLPTRAEQEVLMLVQSSPQSIALMPVLFNGQERFALVARKRNEAGEYVELLSVLPLPEDKIQNGAGKEGSITPPASPSRTN